MRPFDVSSVQVKIVHFVAVALAFAAVADSTAAPTMATHAALATAVSEGRLNAALGIHAAMGRPSGEDEYLVGRALMDLHRPFEASAHLIAARDRGVSRTEERDAPVALLARVADVRIFEPPESPTTDAAIEIHAEATPWSAPVVAAVPTLVAVGRRIFGADLPRERLYLLSTRTRFECFFAAMFGGEPCSWQGGTGTTNVVCCEQNCWPVGSPEALAFVLHECTHAWCATYLRDRYDRDWPAPPWLNEGLADYVASLGEPGCVSGAEERMRKYFKGTTAPTFAGIANWRSFYGADYATFTRERSYWVAYALVEELLGPRDEAPAKIRAILDRIGRTGDVDAAVAAATGKDVRKTFDLVVARYW
jgi:hypothetical protein